MKLLQQLFSIKNENYHKVIRILGLKIKIKNKHKQEIEELKRRIQELENQKKIWVKNCDYIKPPFGPNENEDELILYRNLDETSQLHLNAILSALKKASAIAFFGKQLPTIYDLYNEDELKKINQVKAMSRYIEHKGDYWQYKHFKLPINHFAPEVFIYKHGLEALMNLDNIKNKAIIDAGAFIGDSMLIFRDEFPTEKIISFEPSKKIFEYLKETIKLNAVENVVIENLALSDEENTAYIDDTVCYPFISKTKSVRYCQEINSITLDKYVERHNIKVGLIKTDIEGFEQSLLRGAINTIKNQKPSMLISIYHNYEDFFKIKPMIEDLGLNYRFDFFRGVDGNTVFGDTMLICEPKK